MAGGDGRLAALGRSGWIGAGVVSPGGGQALLDWGQNGKLSTDAWEGGTHAQNSERWRKNPEGNCREMAQEKVGRPVPMGEAIPRAPDGFQCGREAGSRAEKSKPA